NSSGVTTRVPVISSLGAACAKAESASYELWVGAVQHWDAARRLAEGRRRAGYRRRARGPGAASESEWEQESEPPTPRRSGGNPGAAEAREAMQCRKEGAAERCGEAVWPPLCVGDPGEPWRSADWSAVVQGRPAAGPAAEADRARAQQQQQQEQGHARTTEGFSSPLAPPHRPLPNCGGALGHPRRGVADGCP